MIRVAFIGILSSSVSHRGYRRAQGENVYGLSHTSVSLNDTLYTSTTLPPLFINDRSQHPSSSPVPSVSSSHSPVRSGSESHFNSSLFLVNVEWMFPRLQFIQICRTSASSGL